MPKTPMKITIIIENLKTNLERKQRLIKNKNKVMADD